MTAWSSGSPDAAAWAAQTAAGSTAPRTFQPRRTRAHIRCSSRNGQSGGGPGDGGQLRNASACAPAARTEANRALAASQGTDGA